MTEKGKPVADVAQRLGMSVHSLYDWIKLYRKPQEQRQQADLRKLRAQLKRSGAGKPACGFSHCSIHCVKPCRIKA